MVPSIQACLGIHQNTDKRTFGLPCSKVTKLAIGMTQADSRLAGICTYSKHIKIKHRCKLTEFCGHGCLNAKPGLAYAEICITIRTKLVFVGG